MSGSFDPEPSRFERAYLILVHRFRVIQQGICSNTGK